MTKYHSTRCEYDGHRFDSKGERDRYIELKALEKAGKILDLDCQVPFILIPESEHGRAIEYVADFVYLEMVHPNGFPCGKFVSGPPRPLPTTFAPTSELRSVIEDFKGGPR